MQTSLAYIDEVMDRRVHVEKSKPVIKDADRAVLKKNATKTIAGFRVHDQDAENKMLDDLIAKRRAAVNAFIDDRATVREALRVKGVKPLAVVPTEAWNAICFNSKLYRLGEMKDGKVPAMPVWGDWVGLKDHQFDTLAAKDKEGFLDRLFPGRMLSYQNGRGNYQFYVDVILPQPPEDVISVLLKCQDLPLQTAAVADAIMFRNAPSEIRRGAASKQQEYDNYLEWLRKDPIVYMEHGSASAIVAQFGDFPVEKEVVDFVAASDDLIRDLPAQIQPAGYQTLQQLYASQLPSYGTWGAANGGLLNATQWTTNTVGYQTLSQLPVIGGHFGT